MNVSLVNPLVKMRIEIVLTATRRRELTCAAAQAGSRFSALPHLAFASLRSHSLAKAAAAEKAPCLHLPPAAAWRFSPGTPFITAPVQLPLYPFINLKPRLYGEALSLWWRWRELNPRPKAL